MAKTHPPMRRSFGARWSSWHVPGVIRPTWLVNSNPTRSTLRAERACLKNTGVFKEEGAKSAVFDPYEMYSGSPIQGLPAVIPRCRRKQRFSGS